MDIPDAFEASNQEKANVDLDEVEFDALTDHLRTILNHRVDELNDQSLNNDQLAGALLQEGLNLALRAFIAGRCYEEQYSESSTTFPVDMPKDVLGDYIQFLHRRSA